jgi:hypothetical protein
VPIEFHCPHCDKLLKTQDDKAGWQVNCPGCGGPLTVPNPGGVAVEESAVDPPAPRPAAHHGANPQRHRGELILVFGILSWFVCPIFGIVAWVMGNQDLAAMAAGQMDPSGRGLTQAGRIISMIHLGLIGVGVLIGLVVAMSALFFGLAHA